MKDLIGPEGSTYEVRSGHMIAYRGEDLQEAIRRLRQESSDGTWFDLYETGEKVFCGETDNIDTLR